MARHMVIIINKYICCGKEMDVARYDFPTVWHSEFVTEPIDFFHIERTRNVYNGDLVVSPGSLTFSTSSSVSIPCCVCLSQILRSRRSLSLLLNVVLKNIVVLTQQIQILQQKTHTHKMGHCI